MTGICQVWSIMFAAMVAVSSTLAALLVFSAAVKMSHRRSVVEQYAKVGVRENQLNYLAAVLIVGACGVLMGLVWPWIGILATSGLVTYFALAITAHVRAGDTANVLTPVAMEVLSLLALGFSYWLTITTATAGDSQTRSTGTDALAPCTLPELSAPARYGVFDVPENPNHPSGRRLQIGIAVIPATGGRSLIRSFR
jgi:hypothetical protein